MGQNERSFGNPIVGGECFSGLSVLGIGGTTRSMSSSEKALQNTLQFARSLGAVTNLVAGPQLPADIFDPASPARSEQAQHLIAEVRKADVLFVSTPSYHGSVSGYIKNAFDYLEDTRADTRPYLDGVPVGIICCAMGWQAGGATLTAMRSVIHSLRGWPTPLGVIINTSMTTFDPDYRCNDASVENQMKTMVLQALGFASVQASANGLKVA